MNDVLLLGRSEQGSVGTRNLFVRVLQVVVPFFYIIATDDDPAVIPNASGISLLGFTHLHVGITNLGGLLSSRSCTRSLTFSTSVIPYSASYVSCGAFSGPSSSRCSL